MTPGPWMSRLAHRFECPTVFMSVIALVATVLFWL
ncbi:hypothetical protein BH10PSE1_BH10PSE1_01810 [soil metagenome]